MQYTSLVTSDREPMADQSTATIKVQHGEPMNFVWVAYSDMGEVLQEQNDTPKVTLAEVAASKI